MKARLLPRPGEPIEGPRGVAGEVGEGLQTIGDDPRTLRGREAKRRGSAEELAAASFRRRHTLHPHRQSSRMCERAGTVPIFVLLSTANGNSRREQPMQVRRKPLIQGELPRGYTLDGAASSHSRSCFASMAARRAAVVSISDAAMSSVI